MPKHDNNLADLYVKCAKDVLHYEPAITVTAGALETGVFASKIHDFKCMSIGPNNPNIHTYEEKLSITSTNNITKIVKNVLASLDK
jgi:dipeptidase D